MKKKVFSLMMTLLLAFVGVARADELTVNVGTNTNGFVPVYGYYGDAYNKCEFVQPAADLAAMNGGTINGMTFYATQSSVSWGSANFQVFLTEVASTSISGFAGPGTVVYEGALSISGGEMTVTFTTPYTYNGGNLLVGVYQTATGTYVTSTWYGVSATGASGSGYSYSSLSGCGFNERGFLPKTTYDYSAGGGAPAGDQIFAVQDGEVVDTVFVGPRPNGCWMEPFTFQIRNTGANTTISRLDWTPREYFTLVAPELPVQIARDEDIDVQLSTGTSTNTDWQMVAIYGTGRTAAIWTVVAEPYDPAIPDVWEMAYDLGTINAGFSYQGIPSQITPTELHNDYTLPFPEIEEGEDAVYKFTVAQDMVINAYVDEEAENGKVALYTEDFNGEGGPMATNNYTGMTLGAGAAMPFEAQIGDGTSTTGYMPFYCFYNYSLSQQLFLAAELEEASVTRAPMTSLSWYCTASNGNEQSNITIWMANVEETAIGSSSTMAAGMSKVYTGNMTPTANAWNEFVFNEGTFAWDGHSNILISVQRNNGDWASGINWQCGTQSFTASGYSYNDSQGAYNMETNSYVFGTSGSSYGGTTTTRANIIMKGDGSRSGNRELVEIGTGTSTTNVFPTQATYNYCFNEMIYPANQIGMAGTISSVAWHYNGANELSRSVVVYMKNVTRSSFESTTDWEAVTASDVVYTGTLTSAAVDQWITLTLDTPFQYDGTSNLMVAIDDNTGAWNTRHWYYTTGADNCCMTCYNDYTNPDPYNPPTASGRYATLPNIQLNITPTGGASDNYSAGPVIEDMPIAPGTYYLVASATEADYTVYINVDNMPCPIIADADGNTLLNPQPADDADEIEPNSVTLRWMVPDYATGWRLIFGTTYYPDPNHPQTVMYPEDGSFTDHQMANSYTVRNLWNNTNYFWRVEFNNDACPDGVSSPVWGFTTHLNVPQNLTAVDETVFNDETITLNWNAVVDRTYRKYNVYRDGELIGSTQTNNISNTTYTDGPLAYNMDGYTYYVTAVYDEGESAPSNTVNVKVSGYGDVNGHVYEQDGTTGIAGATVTMVGQDEFGVTHTYSLTTDAQGYYTGHIYAGSYNGSAACNGYQTITEPVQGNPVAINYNGVTSPVDYILDENFDPVCGVIAEYYPDSLDPNSPYVKVYWGCGLPGEEIIEPFETGDFSLFDWQIDPTYPWSITTTDPYEGTYCMKSGGAGVANVVSNMTVTVEIPADGLMSFFGKISCESSWDYGYFYIDGVQKGSYTGQGSWGEKKFDITAGTHTFQWRYTKDGSVNSNDDCFYVDYITFYKRPEPAQPGWHTYLESEFDNAYRSNVGNCLWGYEYPVSVASQFAGWNLTKVALFSDDMYNAVGGNFTCNVYVGGDTPGAGTLASTITVDVPVGQGAWCEYDLTTPVNVTGSQPVWVIWTANNTGTSLGYPAGCASHASQYGDWWNNGQDGWDHMGDCTWTMKNFFTNRDGRTVALGAADEAPVAVAATVKADSNLRTYAKGEQDITAECVNPNAVQGAAIEAEATRSFDHYRIYRTNCYNDGPYTEENTVLLATNWPGDTVYIDIEWADLEPGVYKWGVGCVYSGNRGEEIEGPISWAQPMQVGGTRETLTYDFDDSSLQGWTSVDADGDGYGWRVGSDLMSGVAGHNGSADFVFSQSYDNTYGVLYPDNYLVSPQVQLGGSISFWACGQDESYAAEHFGVAVSTTNTSASSFTMLQEWTIGAKSNGAKETIRGNREQSTWTQYTVDLSAYSGMGYVAIRHFNCYDEFYLDVDDITITTSGGPTPGPTPGGTNLNQLALPRESETIWSNCLDKDMYLTDGAVTVNVLLNSADNPEGSTVDFVNYNAAEQELYPVDQIVMDETGYYVFDSFRRGTYQVTVQHEGYETVIDSVNIWNPIDLRYVLIEIIYGVDELYVSSTGWAMWGAIGAAPSGGGQGGGTGTTTFTDDFENGFSNWNAIDADGDGNNWYHSSQSMTYACYDYTGWGHNTSNGFAVSSSYTDCTYDTYDPNNFLVTNQKYSITASSVLNFWADYGNDIYPDHFGVAVATVNNPTPADFTIVWEGSAKNGDAGKSQIRHNGERYMNWRSHSVSLGAYAGQDVYIAFRHFNSYDQYEIYIDDVELTTGAKAETADRHLESFKVLCTSIDGEPIYNANVPADQPFCQLATDELVAGDHYICKVASIYSTGMSDWTECEWQYIPCDNYAGTVNGVTIEGNEISWEYPGGSPTPGPGGQGDTFTESWDNGLNGWTNIDADGDGHMWYHSNEAGNHSTLAVTSHSGAGHVMGESYCNATWAALTPDDYLVSPQQYAIVNGSTLTFWGCAQDVSYAAEHFGVAVSTGSNTNASDFTTIQEWTLTAKSAGNTIIGRDGRQTREGAWHQYTCDLSNYAGQNVWIAIRHFNCTDMFIMCLDDAELTNGAKSNRNPWDLMMTFEAAEGGQYGVVFDGNNFYTSNWGYSSAAHNFYKYDLAGNMLEGFEISGCGTLRGMTYDGQYFYGVANSSTVYCVDLANHSLVNSFSSSYGAMRGITYDPERDGFWVIGNWSGNLTLIDRTGAIQQTGPAPTSASDLAYYKDENDVEHIYCFNNGTNDVEDWVIGNPAVGGSVFNFSNVPGFDSGSSGGCTVASFNNKIAFIGDIQQSPNLIGIYELRDDNTPAPGPTPTGDVLGAMIFADGEWEAFVEYPTNTYTYEGNAEEVCVRMVYNGTNNLPEGNIYFSMSCPECEPYMPGTITCEMPYDINIAQESDMSLKVWWGAEPAAPIEDWLYYDDGANVDAIGLTNGGTFYWGIKFPAASLAAYQGCSVTKVAYYDYTAHSGVVYIYQGSTGNGPSSNLIGTYNYTANGTEDWAEWNIAPVAFDNTQDLWIVMSNTGGGQYVAAMGNYTGDPNGTMISTDGATWYTLDEATGGAISGTWNLRCFVSNQAKGAVEAVEMPLPSVEGGELANAGIAKGGSFNLNRDRANLVKYNVYRSTEAAGEYTMIGSVTEDGSGYYEYIDTPVEAGTYYYQVRAEYDNECESEPALAAGTGNNYVSGTTVGDGVNENGMAIYPNPTKGNVTIEVAGMRHITVVSTLGQVVFDADIEGDNYIMNMSQYTAGMYTVRVVTENGVNVSRITVVR